MMPDQLSLKWQKLWWMLPAVAIVSVAGLSCHPTPTVTQAAFGCPEHEIHLSAYDSVVDTIPIAPRTGAIPEYHDCQRFLIGGQFGPLVAIWAAESVARYFPPLKPGESDSVAYAMAEILDLGNGPKSASGLPEDYAPLGIARGFNCLYLWRSAAPDGFEARIVPQPDWVDLKTCAGMRPVDGRLAALPGLSVRATVFGPADSLPPVARWDWDSLGGVQYISIWCGTAWCEIGPAAGFTSSQPVIAQHDIAKLIDAAYESDDAYPVSDSRWPEMQQVKGWYDQQELEVWKAGKLVPSGVIGTIIPNPVLDVIGSSSTPDGPKFDHRWVPSAYVHVTGAYHGKQLQLEQGVSKLYICKGSAGDCPGATTTGSSADWWSKLVGPDEKVTYSAVEYNEHGGGVIPAGAARWRWLETDGTLWTRCAEGCCTNK